MSDLSPSQEDAVKNWHPRQLVIAPAGSGKTRTLVAAIEHESATTVPRNRIAAITFTNAAAEELRKRLPGLGFVGTVHAFALHHLRMKAKNLAVIDEEESIEQLSESIRRMGYANDLSYFLKRMPERKRDFWKLKPSIRMEEETRILMDYYSRIEGPESACRNPWDIELVDFDSILRLFLAALKDGMECKFASIYVDEFQDTSEVEMAIYQELAKRDVIAGGATAGFQHRLFFVGDPRQSVYGFRGGRIENILEVSNDPTFEVSWLRKNYRSVPEIVNLANRINSMPECLSQIAHRESQGPAIAIRYVAGDIEMLMDIKASEWSSTAILTRTNALSASLVNLALNLGIPVRSHESSELPKEFRFIKKCLAVCAFPNSWNAYLSYLRSSELKSSVVKNVENAQLRESARISREKGEPVWKWNKMEIKDISAFDALFRIKEMGVSRGAILELREWLVDNPCRSALEMYLEFCKGNWTKKDGALSEGIYIGTIHSAKGKEFGTVLLAGVEEGIFPCLGCDIEEERRLLYVAITRAKDYFRAYATDSRTIQYNPSFSKRVETGPSQFFKELQ